jgi:hypothetical protein
MESNATNNLPPVASVEDAVRYLYLAGVAAREGHRAAARRLRAEAARWVEENLSGNGKPCQPPDLELPAGPDCEVQ